MIGKRNRIPALTVGDDPYERGRAHGTAFANDVAANLETYLCRFEASGLTRAEAFAEAQRRFLWDRAGAGRDCQDRQSRTLHPHHTDQVPAIDLRHDEIGEQQVVALLQRVPQGEPAASTTSSGVAAGMPIAVIRLANAVLSAPSAAATE